MLSAVDIEQIRLKGLTSLDVNQQLEFFKKGIPYLNILKPATINDGICVPDEKHLADLITFFEENTVNKTLLKFVPASGAATRMFKSLFEQLARDSESDLSEELNTVIVSMRSFAFYDDLQAIVEKQALSFENLLKEKKVNKILEFLLSEKGLNYGNLPKGLLKFHNYEDDTRTAIEEHLVEGAVYAQNKDKTVNIHFTVSAEHLENFKELITSKISVYEKKFHVSYAVSFSVQKQSTDTIAADDRNLPFRDENGKLVFRPGGHGALLDNLNELDADVIFIKNIDNVVPDKLKNDTIRYKKALAGLLIKIQAQLFDFLRQLENNVPDAGLNALIIKYVEDHTGYIFSDSFFKLPDTVQRDNLFQILNRPIRVCGMVKNQGEPGGGPFWVKADDGSASLQILESSQFNMNDATQKEILLKSTHFNPVDLIVSFKDYKGKKFDLLKFRDPQTGFISLKSKDGKALKAFELPGLWNGSMAFWNTIFVEVPVSTFNPVKTINDLLRFEHQ